MGGCGGWCCCHFIVVLFLIVGWVCCWLVCWAWVDGLLRVLWLSLIGLGDDFVGLVLYVACDVCGVYLLDCWLGGLVHSGACVFPGLLLVGLVSWMWCLLIVLLILFLCVVLVLY